MRPLAYLVALALLLGVASAGAQDSPAAAGGARRWPAVAGACAQVAAGAVMFHSRYGVDFKVDAVDASHGRAWGTFPRTAQPDARVPVKCHDLVTK